MQIDDDAGAEGRSATDRTFRVNDVEWIARLEGQGVAGSDAIAGRAVQIVGFARADDPDRTVVRAVCALRSLEDLFDSELAGILAAGQPVEEPGEPTREGRSRRGRRDVPTDDRADND